MTRRAFVFLLVLALAACDGAGFAPPASPSPSGLGADRVQLLFTSDIHGHLDSERVSTGSGSFERGGMALLASLVARERARAPERTLVLDAGDLWQGTFASNSNRGTAMVEIMNRIGYDAVAVGNHDFDWGADVLQARIKEAKFPFLGANVIDTATGDPPPYLRPYVVRDLGVARVAIIGVAPQGAEHIIKPTGIKGLKFIAPADAVRRYLPEMRRQADLVVVLAHIVNIGVWDDLALARAVPDLDVVIGGHSHTVTNTALLEGKTTVVRPGRWAEDLGRLDVSVDGATREVGVRNRGSPLLVVAQGQGILPDREVAALVAARVAEGKQLTSRVVGRTLVDLPEVQRGESALGNLIADSMLEYCRGEGWGSDVALHNGGGIRAALAAGDITYGAAYEVLPFDDVLVSIDLTGAQLQQILDKNGNNMVIAGGSYAFRQSAPTGSRATSLSVGGAPLDARRTYHVCTVDYLALGGDGLSVFTEGKNLLYGDLEAEAFAAYLTKHSPVSPKVEGRIAQ